MQKPALGRGNPRVLIYTLFALSGVAGLIYEGTWARYLKLFLGHSSYGQILTLCIYMGGLGIGSFLAASCLPRIRNPLRAYALTELAIGLLGVFYHPIYLWITEGFYSAQWSSQLGTSGAEAVKIVLAILTTLPPAILLGMTFPFIGAGLIRQDQDCGQLSLPRLYFTNSLGAAIGLMAASYVVIPWLGSQGTLWVAAGINLLLGIGFWLLSSPATPTFSSHVSSSNAILFWQKSSLPPISIWLSIAAITGLTSFIYEVVWIRLLSLMMGSSTHSFDQMVSAFILGLALGSWVSARLLKKDPLIMLALAQIAMAFFALCTIYFHGWFFDLMNLSNLIFRESPAGYWGWTILKYLVAIIWMVPTSFFAGMTLPFLTYILTQITRSESHVGKVYGWNTLGAIAGAALGGLLLIPHLQLKWSLGLAAFTDMAVGIVLLWIWRPAWRHKTFFWLALLVLIFPVFLIDFDAHMVTAGVFRGHKDYGYQEKVWVQNGKTATISIHENPLQRYIKTNGKADASILKDRNEPVGGDEITQAATAFIPMATRRDPYQAAMVGFGSGMSAYYLLTDPLLERLDVVEIEEEMLHLAQHFRPINARAFDDPRVHLYIDDARTFFHTHGKQYDVLVSVPSNPWVSGVSSLFSIEFYHHIQRYLKPGGTLVQWLQLYEFENDLLLHILKALDESFQHVVLYRIPDEPDVVILASNEPVEQKEIRRFATTPEIKAEFERMHHPWFYFGEQNFLARTQTLAPLLKNIPANSEYIPWVDNRAEMTRWSVATVGLMEMFDSCEVCWPMLLDAEDYQSRLEFKNWLRASQPPDPYLRRVVRQELERRQAWALQSSNRSTHQPSPRESDWQPFWKDFSAFLAQLPFSPDRDSVPEYQMMKALVDQNQVPLDISLQFEFSHRLAHGQYREATAMIPTLNEVFHLMGMPSIFQRNLALTAFLSQNTKDYRTLFRRNLQHTPFMDASEKRLIATLLQMDLKHFPLNSEPDYD